MTKIGINKEWRTKMSNVEDRLARLEKEVEALKREHSESIDLAAKKKGWIKKIVGTFENDPEFDEILRLGREARASEVLNNE